MLTYFKTLLIPILMGLGLIAGFGREVIVASLFGTSINAEIFRVAYGLPSIFSDSLAVSLVAILIPYFLSNQDGQESLNSSTAFRSTFLIAAVTMVVGILTMPMQASLFAPEIRGADRHNLIVVGALCWCMFFFVFLSIPLRALLSSKKTIWPNAASQLIRSGFFVILLLALIFVGLPNQTYAIGLAGLGSGVAIFAVSLWLANKDANIAHLYHQRGNRHFKSNLPLIWAIVSIILIQLILSSGRLIDRSVSNLIGPGYLAAIEYSYAIMMAVAALIGTSTNIILAPKVAKAIAKTGEIGPENRRIVTIIFLVACCTGVLMSVLARNIVSILFERGNFDEVDTLLTSQIFAIHALSLGPLVVSLLLFQILLQKKKTGLIFSVAIIKLVIKIISIFLVFVTDIDIYKVALTFIIAEFSFAIAIIFMIQISNSHPRKIAKY
ncbi:lipid II flippase MurJ [Maritalea myrionectae]|uniref:lipid II flippase MurJ n=1 Tax=Maritalea myrionectae TaxID=454601 RepID=UPI00041BEC8B|nr:lipid II flippase MurJ [Maritalea myrionectae]